MKGFDSNSANSNDTATTMPVDTRNMAWRTSNVGSKLLSKMGWSDGQAVGKRQRRSTVASSTDSNITAEDVTSSAATTVSFNSEGLRVMKRQDGLGIGATAASSAYSNASNAVQHVQDYVNVLALLAQRKTDDEKVATSKKKKKRKRCKDDKEESSTAVEALSTTTTSATALSSKNIMTNPKIRKAKFQQKSTDDYKGIFGSFYSNDIVSTVVTASVATKSDDLKYMNKKKHKSKEEKAKKKEKISKP